MKEWEKLCRRYKVSDVGRTRQSRAETLRSHKSDENSSDDDFSSGEYEVSRLVGICYGNPNRKGKRGLHFKVNDVLSFCGKCHLVTVCESYLFFYVVFIIKSSSFMLCPLAKA